MHRHDHKEREPKAFPQYDDAAHIDSAAVAELPPWEQTREPKGDPKATAYTEKYCEEQTAERYKSFRRLALNHVFDGILCR